MDQDAEAMLFYELQDMFPHISRRWVQQNAGLGQQRLVEMVLSGAYDEYMDNEGFNLMMDALRDETAEEQEPIDEDEVGFEVEQPRLRVPEDDSDSDSDDEDDDVLQRHFPQVDLDDLQDVDPAQALMRQFERLERRPPMPHWARSVINRRAAAAKEEKIISKPRTCSMCKEVMEHYACCHVKGELTTEHSLSTHVSCENCLLKNGVMLNRTWILKDKSGIICLVKGCPNIIGKEFLVEATGAYATEMLIGNLFTPSSKANEINKREEAQRAREEEDMLEGEQLEQVKASLRLVNKEVMKQLLMLNPMTCPLFLLENADRGVDGVFNLIDRMAQASEEPPKRKRHRRDGRGATSIIENGLDADHTFNCPVCFEDIAEHLGVECVPLPGVNAVNEVSVVHAFCCECIRQQSAGTSEQQVLADGGGGIRCLDPECKGMLMLEHIVQLLDERTRTMVEDCATTEALLASGIEVEKCKRCPYAMEVAESKEEEQVFHCRRCNFEYCRRCERDWDANHKAHPDCAELDPEGIRKRMEQELADIAIHKC